MKENNDENVVDVRILDRSYRVKCPPKNVQALQEAARYLDDQMRKVRQSSNVMSTDRIAVVAALNACHELIDLKKLKTHFWDSLHDRVQGLKNKIHGALVDQQHTSI